MFEFKGTTVDVDEVAALEFREIPANGKVYAYATLRSGHVVTLATDTEEDMEAFKDLQKRVQEAIMVRNMQNRKVLDSGLGGINELTQPLMNLGFPPVNQPMMPPGHHG